MYSHISSPLQSRNKQKYEVRGESNTHIKTETNSLKENNQIGCTNKNEWSQEL